tara:strand:+ start:9172 stop:9870 length:699 start_codon:yes stop_codon:yes gene_type:complete
MNQIANHNAFALPIEQQDFNSHVSLMRSYSLLDIAKYKHKARRARMKAAAYVRPEPIAAPVGAARLTYKQQKKRSDIIDGKSINSGMVFTQISDDGKTHYLRSHNFNHHVNLFYLMSIPRPNSRSWTAEKIQEWCISSQIDNRKVSTRADMFSLGDLRGNRRTREIVLVRQLSMYLCYKLTLLSYPSIGRLFGDRDHTTVLNACRNIDGFIAAERLFINGYKFDPDLLEIKL